MTTTPHKLATIANNHGLLGLGPYASSTLRRAAVLTSADVGKVAQQTDTDPATFWMVMKVVSGAGTWTRIDTGAESLGFTGDFGALFTSYGLTVTHYVRSDLGRTLAGSLVASITAQTGPTITEHTGGAGLATVTTGLSGHAGFANSGASQYGDYTLAMAAPGTTPVHEWHVVRLLSAPNAPSFLSGGASLGNFGIIVNQSTNNLYINNTSYGGPTTMPTNTWGCLEASFANDSSDYIKFGAGAAVVPGFSVGNNANAGARCLGGFAGGNLPGIFEWLAKITCTGTRANFVTAAAAAKTAAQSFYGGSIT